MSDTTPVPENHHRGEPIDRGRAFGYAFIIIAIIMVVQGIWLQYDSAQTAECQAEYNADVSSVVAQRSLWADEDRAALNTMVFKLVDPKVDEQGREQAVQTYVKVARTNDKNRQATPLPKKTDCN